MIDLATQRHALLALAAAALFGASTPLAKLLQADITPGLLAGLLYLGSGAGLALVQVIRRFRRRADCLRRFRIHGGQNDFVILVRHTQGGKA